MTLPNKRFHALIYLLVLFPLWWIQRAGASDFPTRHIAPASGGSSGGSSNLNGGGDDGDDNGGGDDDDDNGGGGDDGDDNGGGDGDDGDDGGDSDDSDDGDDNDDCNDNDDGDDNGDGLNGDDDDSDDGDDNGDGDDDSDDGDGDDDDGCGDITDCNGNGIEDAIDISMGTSPDLNHDGVPDECQPGVTPFCVGDGAANGGADCPCLNNVAAGTIAGCINRDGVGSVLTSTGNPSVSNDTLVLIVTNVPNGVPGYFFQGNSDAGYIPFGNGLKCIGGPFRRLTKISGMGGVEVQFPPPGGTPISEQLGLPAGVTRFYQVLHRDSGGPCGTSTNASNGLKVVWGL